MTNLELREESRRLIGTRREGQPTWLLLDTMIEHLESLQARIDQMEKELVKVISA